jgi:tetratricopeptide (TPR) repeat protein
MKSILYFTAGLFLSCSVFSQVPDRMAVNYFNTGCHYNDIKNYAIAIADFSMAIRLDPGFEEAYENRGVAEYSLGHFNDAISDFNKALEIDPDDFSTYGRRGWAKYCIQDLPGAMSDFTRAINGSGNPGQYYNIRGEIKYQLADYKGAVSDFSKVLKFGAGSKNERSEALFWRGYIEIDLGQRQSGCLDLAKATKLGFRKAGEIEEIYCR